MLRVMYEFVAFQMLNQCISAQCVKDLTHLTCQTNWSVVLCKIPTSLLEDQSDIRSFPFCRYG